MKITFIGTGYVGLVSGVMLSHLGHQICCYDIDESKITGLKNKKSPIFEKNLDKRLAQQVEGKKINFTSDYKEAFKDAQCIFITVGTPPKDDGSADLTAVFKAAENIAEVIDPESVVVIKSTVPPGTCEKVQDLFRKKGLNNEVVSNPEYLREGVAVDDFLNPDRIIIGCNNSKAEKIMREIYEPQTNQGINLLVTDQVTSELIKYAANGFLSCKIAFINEMANLCEKLGADVTELATGIGLDHRIGNKFLQSGPGYGGSCFPKDTLALENIAKNNNTNSFIISATIKANETRTNDMITKILNKINGNLNEVKLAFLGLSYKAETDDVRASPAMKIIKKIKQKGILISAYDPQAMNNAKLELPDIIYAKDEYEAAQDADAIIITTEWSQFKKLDFQRISDIIKNKLVIDMRNIMNQNDLENIGFEYIRVG